MPWDYKTNKPDAVKYLHPKIAKKAIRIANAIVENGGDEGVAIATGIKKAKGLVKIAMAKYSSSHNMHDSGVGDNVCGGELNKLAGRIPGLS